MHKTIQDLIPINSKCPRCSLCKFPPLVTVESQAYSGICPSYREFMFHSHSGGGRVVMAIALSQGRAELTEEAQKAVFTCTLCGGCDMACKYSSDIEVLEMLYALRAESFERLGPLPGQSKVLDRIEEVGHPLFCNEKKGEWIAREGLFPGRRGKDKLLFVGDRFALIPEYRKTLRNLLRLLAAGGCTFGVLGDQEPTTGRAALDIGDRERFDRLVGRAVKAVRDSGAKTVICADPLDLNVFRAHAPKVADVSGIRFVSAIDFLDRLVRRKKLKPKKPIRKKVAYHDPCTLGRLSEPYNPWNGETKKIMGQLVIYDPPRPVNRGTNGYYEPPRRLLSALPGIQLVEFHRRKEYSFCCGGEGMVRVAGYTDFVENTATHRMEEARAVGAELVVTACPSCVSNLGGTKRTVGIEVCDVVDILADSVFG